MRNMVWAILLVLSGICAAQAGPEALEGHWQFSVEEGGAMAVIQNTSGHLTLACYAGDPLLEMQVGERLYPYRGEPGFPIVIAVRGSTYTPTFGMGIDGYWIRISPDHPLINDLRRGFEAILSEPDGAITATISLSGSFVAIGQLLDWCQSHAGSQ